MKTKTPITDSIWDDAFPAALNMSPVNRCVFFFELCEKLRDHARNMEKKSTMKTLIIENGIGGWSILTQTRQIGNYATRADAVRVATQNGWEVA